MITLCIIATSTLAQTNIESAFAPFVGGTWVCDTTWVNDVPFYQAISYEFDLDNQIVKVETEGYLKPSGGEIGKRNHGIRYMDKQSGALQFIEFDVHGGVTTGDCMSKGDTLMYSYAYQTDMGVTSMTEMYVITSENEMTYQIGIYEYRIKGEGLCKDTLWMGG